MPAVLDTFTDTDGVTIGNHTPDVGNPWVQFTSGSSAAEIRDNVLDPLEAGTDGWVVQSDVADCTITATVRTGPTETSVVGVVFRNAINTDGNNMWLLTPDHVTISRWILRRYKDGKTVDYVNSTLGTESKVERAVKVVLAGSSIKCYVDNNLLFDLAEERYLVDNTYHGFQSENNAGNWMDDFKVAFSTSRPAPNQDAGWTTITPTQSGSWAEGSIVN